MGLAWPYKGAAQDPSTFRIVVKSAEDGTPVVGANVALREPQNGETAYAGITDTYGFVEFDAIDPGRYELRVSFVGFRPHQRQVELSPGESRVEQVVLAVNVAELNELIIRDERQPETDAGKRTITETDIARVPTAGSGGDLAAFLQTVPGVMTTGDRGGDLYIRGGTSSQNKILVDNLPVVKPFHISNLFSAFPERTVQTAELYAGGFGAGYADATSGVLDVKLRPGNFKSSSGGGSLSPYLVSGHLEAPLQQDRQSIWIMARKSLIELTSPTLYNEERPLNFYDVSARYSYQGDTFTCNITAMHTNDNGRINVRSDVGVAWQNTVAGGTCFGYSERFASPVQITAGYSGYENSEESGAGTELSSRIDQLYFKFNHQETILGLPTDYGFKLKFRSFNAALDERFTSFESITTRQALVNVYATGTWKVNRKLTLKPGFTTLITMATTPTAEPRLRMTYQPRGDEQTEWTLAVGNYYQTMTNVADVRDAGTGFRVWKAVEGTLDKMPQALHGIIGHKRSFGNTLTLRAEGYVKSHRNIPVAKWNLGARLETETTRADGLAYGGDVQLEYERGPFFGMLNYGYAQVEYEAGADDLGAWIGEPVYRYRPPHDQRHKFNALMSYNWGNLTANLRWEYGSGQPFTRIYGFDFVVDLPYYDPLTDIGDARILFSRPLRERMPAYHRLDIGLKYQLDVTDGWAIEAEAGAINVYDRENIFYFNANTLQTVYQSPFLPYLSLRATFN